MTLPQTEITESDCCPACGRGYHSGQQEWAASARAKALALPQFDPEWIQDDAVIGCCARRGMGKSEWLRYIMPHVDAHHEIPYWFVFTLTAMNMFWEKLVPLRNILPLQFMDHWIKLAIGRAENFAFDSTAEPGDPRMALILDDVVADRKAMYFSSGLDFITSAGRHAKMLLAYTTQHVRRISPMTRSNSDWIVLFHHNNRRDIETIYDEWLYGEAEHLNEAYHMLEMITGNTITLYDEDGNKQQYDDGYHTHPAYTGIAVNVSRRGKALDAPRLAWTLAEISTDPIALGNPNQWRFQMRDVKDRAQKFQAGGRNNDPQMWQIDLRH